MLHCSRRVPTRFRRKDGVGNAVPKVGDVGLIGFFSNFNMVDVTLVIDEDSVWNGFGFNLHGQIWMKDEGTIEGAVEVLFSGVVPLAHVGVFFSGFS